MRERLVLVFVVLSIAIIACYGVPRAYMVVQQTHQEQERKIERSVDLLAALLPERAHTDGVTDEYLEGLLQEAERIEYLDITGEPIAAAGEELTGHRNDIVMDRHLDDGTQVVLARSGTLIQDRVVEAVMPVVVLGLVLTVASGIAGFALARRLSRPFQDLAKAARQLGTGRFDLSAQEYTLPEAQEIGSALYNSSRQLEGLLERERQFAANSSHQLRTPITALRLELEDLTSWPETPPTVARQITHALGELDRLTAAVAELLDLARGKQLVHAKDTNLTHLLREAAKRWERHAATAGRALEVHGPPVLPARLHPGAVGQILDVLIENALTHGAGAICLEAAESGTHLKISVQDEGPRPTQKDIFQRRITHGDGEGLGLAVAAELAQAAGGQLRLDPTRTTTFSLALPKRDTTLVSDPSPSKQ
jgi:signal transduction histidine kinase